MSTRIYTLYVDGACSGNPGPGGWAVVGVRPNTVWASGGEEETTNNTMELKAVLVALDFVRPLLLEQNADQILILSDSQWAVNMVLGQWKPKVHVSEVLVGVDVVRILGEKVRVQWIRGHQGEVGNELANSEAQQEAQRIRIGS